jgi:hypothetical protein
MKEYINNKTDIDFWIFLFLSKLKNEKKKDFFLNEIYRKEFYNSEAFLGKFKNDKSGYVTLEEFTLNRINEILEECSLGKIKELAITNTYSLPRKIVKELFERKYEPREIDNEALEEYAEMIHHYTRLETRKLSQGEDYEFTKFALHEIPDHLGELISLIPEYNRVSVEWSNVAEFNFESLIEPNSTQIEAFYGYIDKLNTFENKVDVPIDAFQEKDFDIAKILYYLDSKYKIKITDFFPEKSWEIDILEKYELTDGIFYFNVQKRSDGYYLMIKNGEDLYLGKTERAEIKLLDRFKSTLYRVNKKELEDSGDSLQGVQNRINNGVTNMYRGIKDLGFKLSSVKEKGESCFRIEKVD